MRFKPGLNKKKARIMLIKQHNFKCGYSQSKLGSYYFMKQSVVGELGSAFKEKEDRIMFKHGTIRRLETPSVTGRYVHSTIQNFAIMCT